MAFQDKLKELMTEKNIKAVDLARATGLSEAAISDYLKGKKEPRGRQSISIAKALDVSLDTLWETGFQEGEHTAATNISDTLAKLIEETYGISAQWIMTGEGEKTSDSSLSAAKLEFIRKIQKMPEDEIAALLAFANSLDSVRKVLHSNDRGDSSGI